MNRREALRTLAAGSATGALAAGAIVATVPAEAAIVTPIEEMVTRLRLLFDRSGPEDETEEEGDAHDQLFRALQATIIRAEPQAPRDVALQFLADTHFGQTGNSDEFRERLLALARGGAAPVAVADPMRTAVEEYETAYVLQGEMVKAKDWSAAEAIYHARIGPAEAAIDAGPATTTLAGAIAAVRYVASQTDWLEDGQLAALRSALAYFTGRT